MRTEAQMAELQRDVVHGLAAALARDAAGGGPVPEAVTALHADLERFLDEIGSVALRCAGPFLLRNGERVRPETVDRASAQRLVQALRARGLVGVRFEPGLEAQELGAALQVLAVGAEGATADWFAPAARLREAGVRRVLVQSSAEETAAERSGRNVLRVHRRQAQRVYLRALHLHQECSAALEKGDRPSLRDLKRVLHLMIDLMEEDDTPLVGFTNIKSLGRYTLTHAVNVAILALVTGRAAGLGRCDLAALGLAALLHDVGRLGVPVAVPERDGPLSAAEWRRMQAHTVIGTARLLGAGWLESAPDAALVCLEHHMRQEVAGYPQTLAGCEPALASRIVQIADAYDALTSRRVYRRQAVSPDRVMAFMLRASGSWFDPLFLKVFVHALGVYPPGTTVQLDTGEVGVVVKANRDPQLLHRPQVRLMLDAAGHVFGEEQIADLAELHPGARGFARSVVRGVDPEPLDIVPATLFLTGMS